MFTSFFVRRSVFAAVFAVPALVAACGARGPLDIIVVQEQVDAGGFTAPSDAQPIVTADVVAPPDEASVGGGFDAGALLNCGACVGQHCQMQITACIQSATCGMTLQCAATMCLAGGMPSPQCILGCANGDPQSLLQLYGLFQCVQSNCPTCTSALGGALGGGGPGGGGG